VKPLLPACEVGGGGPADDGGDGRGRTRGRPRPRLDLDAIGDRQPPRLRIQRGSDESSASLSGGDRVVTALLGLSTLRNSNARSSLPRLSNARSRPPLVFDSIYCRTYSRDATGYSNVSSNPGQRHAFTFVGFTVLLDARRRVPCYFCATGSMPCARITAVPSRPERNWSSAFAGTDSLTLVARPAEKTNVL
jgi:hypothetical protein